MFCFCFCFCFCCYLLSRACGRSRCCSRCCSRGSRKNHEDLHATSQTQHQMECRLLLNVVVTQRLSILQLLACEDEALLVRRDALLVLDLLLDILNGVARLNVHRNRLACKSLHENLHSIYCLVCWEFRSRTDSIFRIFFNFLMLSVLSESQ